MTKAEFKARAEQCFLRSNPTATVTVTGWIEARKVTYPTGLKEYAGQFHAIAEGYKPRIMHASGDDSYMMIR